MAKKRLFRKKIVRIALSLGISVMLIATGAAALWVATLKMPDLESFETRKVVESTKIYDRTGEILLYDTGINTKRTSVPLSEISPWIQKATIAIEDARFYENIGIEPLAIVRAVVTNFIARDLLGGQGGSTITQQVIKNALLTKDKTLSRKFKEWVLSIKLTRVLSKDQILNMYLNETAYGGTLYGVEEASMAFFGRPASEVTLAQAAYLAAIPQAPTYYAPNGSHRDDLDSRQRLVLNRMKDLSMITEEEYEEATSEKVQFLSRNDASIRAPHFVMFVREYLISKYGEDVVANGGLRITTTLDYDMQEKAQDVVTNFGTSLQKNFNASNTAMVAVDPKTGDILMMVGSRDYFDPSIDGNYNIALAKRQPGSTFKPFVYATAFKKGYTPQTILFDTETEFSTRCTVEGKPKNPSDDPEEVCYSPVEYDNIFEGPMTIKRALAQSRNIPAVKTLYLAGINSSIATARDMGITSLTDPARYGLTLVLGGGEVSLLDLTSAYGVFANNGIRNPYRSVLKVEDSDGIVMEEARSNFKQVLDPEIAAQISDILSDNSVRMNSLKPIADSVGRQVAIKTGTTNDYRDVWAVGYTPNIVVGAWAGKNDNTPMQHNVAGLIIAPVWGAFMSQVAKNYPADTFPAPPPPLTDNKPVLRGIWQGGQSYIVDSITGKLATEHTPQQTRKEVVFNSVHNTLHWIDKNDPRGAVPQNPSDDSQYEYWEYGVRKWFDNWKLSHPEFTEETAFVIPSETDDIHSPDKAPSITIISPTNGDRINPNQMLKVQLQITGPNPVKKTEIYLNGNYVLSSEIDPLNVSFIPADVGSFSDSNNTLSVIVYDSVYNRGQASTTFNFE